MLTRLSLSPTVFDDLPRVLNANLDFFDLIIDIVDLMLLLFNLGSIVVSILLQLGKQTSHISFLNAHLGLSSLSIAIAAASTRILSIPSYAIWRGR